MAIHFFFPVSAPLLLIHQETFLQQLILKILRTETGKVYKFEHQEVNDVRRYKHNLTYLLTPWSRVPLEKLTSILCS